jgi:hypothetical protein
MLTGVDPVLACMVALGYHRHHQTLKHNVNYCQAIEDKRGSTWLMA